METLLHFFQRGVIDSIHRSLGIPLDEIEADLAICAEEQFGHYQCNSALKLGKIQKKSPRQVAEQIIHHLNEKFKNCCSKIEIAGPGFINFTLDRTFLSEALDQQLRDPKLGAVPYSKKERIVVEFSSPNVAKELHVGHIRSTIIGDCLARLFEFLEADVIRLNHIGDWGTQFGMLITYMREELAGILEKPVQADLSALMGWYRAAKKRFDEDPEFKKRAQLQVVLLQAGEPKTIEAWKAICEISRRGFQEIYDLLDVKLIERGESFYNPYLKEVVDECEKKGLVEISDGAKCIFLEGFVGRDGEKLPMMIQKSDGGYNYDTTDLAALRHRIFVEKADRVILVVDAGQSLHFQMLFAAAKQLGWIQPHLTRVDHVGFGLVLGADGKKFKTRSGETEKLIDLLLGAVNEAHRILRERLPEASELDLKEMARIIGIDAVKYADLSVHRIKDYTFSYDRMLRFEGNTAVFLLYSYVRINGIKRKTQANMDQILSQYKISLKEPAEISLGIHLRRFGEVLESLAEDLLPHRLADYLYHLAEKFNAFFRDCRVEGSPEEGSRLVLCELTSRILKQGLELLGLQTVERL